jgi:RHS repeat-associated protein
VNTKYFFFGIEIDSEIASSNEGDLEWGLTDIAGTQRDHLTSSGQVDTKRFETFGLQIEANLGDTDGISGREFDQQTGLQYNRARYYDPSVGRFISRDPIQFGGQDSNLFRYAYNSPTNYVDPSGLVTAIEYVSLAARNSAALIRSCVSEFLQEQVLDTTIYFIAAVASSGASAYVGRTGPNFDPRFKQHLARERFGKEIAGLLEDVKIPAKYRKPFEQWAFELFDHFAGEGHRLNKRNEISPKKARI